MSSSSPEIFINPGANGVVLPLAMMEKSSCNVQAMHRCCFFLLFSTLTIPSEQLGENKNIRTNVKTNLANLESPSEFEPISTARSMETALK